MKRPAPSGENALQLGAQSLTAASPYLRFSLTVNQARGCNRSIADRFDLTIECIRRYYINEKSPLTTTFDRYDDYFALFESFAEYVRFFHLDDIIKGDASARFFMPFDDFQPSAVPKTLDAYLHYRHEATEFIQARNQRIEAATTDPA